LQDIACATCRHRDCDGSKKNSWFIFEDEELNKCPLPLLTQKSFVLISQYPHYDKGYLPVAGGMLDQTSIFVEGMAIISSELSKHQEEEAESRRRKGRG